MECILNIGKNMGFSEKEVLTDYVNYLAKSDIWKQKTIWSAANCSDALSWWEGLCGTKVLSKIAQMILRLPASSASCERNWKDHSLIKTKKRNRLTIERTEKLVMVKSNLNLLSPNEIESLREGKKTKSVMQNTDEIEQDNNTEVISENENESNISTTDSDDINYDTDDIIDDDSDDDLEDSDIKLPEVQETDEIVDEIVTNEYEYEAEKVEDDDTLEQTEIMETKANLAFSPSTDSVIDTVIQNNVFYLKEGQKFFILK